MQYYSVNKPHEGELVLVNFTDINDNFVDAILIDYQFRGMMKHQDATKKRKVLSWKKIIQLNKNMVARVEDVDEYAKIVQLSLINLNDTNTNLTFEQIQDKLMIVFIENKLMENFIKSLCIVNNFSFELIWTKLIHPIDSERRTFNDDNDENISIWKYFNDNFNNLELWITNSNLDNNIFILIKDLFNKRNEQHNKKIMSKIGIVSPFGINHTKLLLKNILSTINFNYTFNYDSTPYYLFESSSNDSTEDDHYEFIKKLEIESQKMNPKVYIKNEYIGKII